MTSEISIKETGRNEKGRSIDLEVCVNHPIQSIDSAVNVLLEIGKLRSPENKGITYEQAMERVLKSIGKTLLTDAQLS